MSLKNLYYYTLLFLLTLLFISCGKYETDAPPRAAYGLSKPDTIPAFNSENAYAMVEKQVLFGPRNPGSLGHGQTLNFLKAELTKYADEVRLQSFSYPGYDETLELTNIIARFNPAAKNRIMFSAHWDTRPRGEEAEDSAKHNLPIAGANDGASGVGVLLEIARLIKESKPAYGIDIILFDGEDYGQRNDLANYCLGAKYFSANLNDYKPAFGILLDMVGDKDAFFPKEGHSVQYAPDIVNMIWSIAEQTGSHAFMNNESPEIYDDHVALNQSGIKTVDIIDLELIGSNTPNERRNYWHTDKDTMENIGKETLRQVGTVLTTLIYSLQFTDSMQ